MPRTSTSPVGGTGRGDRTRTGTDRTAGVSPAWQPLGFEDFYRHERPMLVTLAAALCGRADADDVAQEALLVVYRRWREISERDHPQAFARRVCANLAVSHFRRRTREARAVLRLASQRPGPSPERLSPEALPHDDLWRAVRALPHRQAQVVALHYVCDLAVADVARTLEVSEGTVKTQLHRARRTLAALLGAPAEEVPR